jgi:hypothetical protein
MSVAKAKANYTGQGVARRLNCAEAIVEAFRDKFPLKADELAIFVSCGTGRAPGGCCGSLYAAKVLLGKNHPDKVEECEQVLARKAGSTKCREIRSLKKLSCVGCVETIAGFMEAV